MNHDEVVVIVFDSLVEFSVLFTTVFGDARDDVRVRVDTRDLWGARNDVLTALIELTLEVLLGGTDTGIDRG